VEDGLWVCRARLSFWLYDSVSSSPAWFLHASLCDDDPCSVAVLLAGSEQFLVLLLTLCVGAVGLGVVSLMLFPRELVLVFWFRLSVTLLSVYKFVFAAYVAWLLLILLYSYI